VRGDLVDIIFSVRVSVPAGVDSTHWYGQRGSLQLINMVILSRVSIKEPPA
jgi:hypothetical protein